MNEAQDLIEGIYHILSQQPDLIITRENMTWSDTETRPDQLSIRPKYIASTKSISYLRLYLIDGKTLGLWAHTDKRYNNGYDITGTIKKWTIADPNFDPEDIIPHIQKFFFSLSTRTINN